MDKVSKTPRTDALHFGYKDDIDMQRHELLKLSRTLERELAAQKELFRVLEDEMLVMMDERNASAARSNLLACALRSLLSKCPDCGGTGEVQTMTLHLESCFVCAGERGILLKECGK
jgi:hypothetical protein